MVEQQYGDLRDRSEPTRYRRVVLTSWDRDLFLPWALNHSPSGQSKV
jgi:hypothetical protein